MLKNLFTKKPAQTLREQYGTPWAFTANPAMAHLMGDQTRRPADDGEVLLELLDFLNPTETYPMVMQYEDVTETISSYDAGVRFIYGHLFNK